MLSFKARITGRLAAEADGLPVVVPRGCCDVRSYGGMVSLSWAAQDGVPHTVVLAADRFEEHLEAGAVALVDPAELCRAKAHPPEWSVARFKEVA
jgi:hypothetical protein